MRRAFRIIAAMAAFVAAALFSLDLRSVPPAGPARVVMALHSRGDLRAGAARVEIDVPFPAVTAGYGPHDRHSVASSAAPLRAQTVAFEVGRSRLALVSIDLLEVPATLVADVKAQLGDGAPSVWICATHTHSGLGGFDPSLIAQVVGTGRYSTAVHASLVKAIVESIQGALGHLAPATMGLGEATLASVVQSRDRDARAEDRLVRWSLATATQTIDVALLAAHPTLIPRDAAQLSPDYPGLLSEQIPTWETNAASERVGIVLQGALGDASIRREVAPNPPDVVAVIQKLWPGVVVRPGPLELSAVTTVVSLPAPEIGAVPGWARQFVDNLVAWGTPTQAEVSVLQIGSLTLVAIPGEVTFDAEQDLLASIRRQAKPGDVVTVAGLCNGYVGYVDSPQHVTAGTGEAQRTYFGPGLVDRLRVGVERAQQPGSALSPPP